MRTPVPVAMVSLVSAALLWMYIRSVYVFWCSDANGVAPKLATAGFLSANHVSFVTAECGIESIGVEAWPGEEGALTYHRSIWTPASYIVGRVRAAVRQVGIGLAR